ncbi:MAG: dockerin type I repeat-containing protein, partial [Ruminococcus sp.]|nr:dockerin type I repeat-containing protein [Ruminococcus sp.]
YSFDQKLKTSCIYNKTTYTLVEDNTNRDVCFLYIIEGASSKKQLILRDIKLSDSAMMSVDKSGNIYILNSKEKVQVYNKSGKLIYTHGTVFFSIIPFNDYTLATNNKGLYKLTASSQTKISGDIEDSDIYKISEEYIGDTSGNVYKISDSVSKILNTSEKGLFRFSETADYLVTFSKNTLYAYNKYSGAYVESYDYTDKIFALATYNDKIVVIKKDSGEYESETVSQTKAFPKPETGNENSSPLLNNTLSLTGKYIYVDSGMTIAQFKSKINYDSYEISFGDRKSGKIRTDMKVEFIKGKISLKYTFVVKGDVTGEGNVNSRDTSAMFNHLLNFSKLKGAFKLAGDLNGDGKLSNADLVMLAKMQ